VKGKGKSPAKKLTARDLVLKIWKEDGFAGFWGGYGASMLSTFSQSYAYFLAYTLVRTSYLRRLRTKQPNSAPTISTAMELALGALAGALAQIFTIPVSVIATRQQIGPSSLPTTTKAQSKAKLSFLEVAQEIIEEDGITGLWAGLRPGLVLTVNPAITYGVFERVKGIMILNEGWTDRGKLKPWAAFVVGALSKTLATVVTYPYIMAKVRLQAKLRSEPEEAEASVPPLTEENTGPGTDAPTFAEVSRKEQKADVKEKAAMINKRMLKYKGAVDLLQKVWKQQGFIGWYQGMSAQITKAVLCQALLFMMKEQFEVLALFLQIALRRVTSKVRSG